MSLVHCRRSLFGVGRRTSNAQHDRLTMRSSSASVVFRAPRSSGLRLALSSSSGQRCSHVAGRLNACSDMGCGTAGRAHSVTKLWSPLSICYSIASTPGRSGSCWCVRLAVISYARCWRCRWWNGGCTAVKSFTPTAGNVLMALWS
jgi:hypothetical protein